MVWPPSFTAKFYRSFIGDINFPDVPMVGNLQLVKQQMAQHLLGYAGHTGRSPHMRPNKAALFDNSQNIVAHIEITTVKTGLTTQDIP